MQKWLLPTISEVLAHGELSGDSVAGNFWQTAHQLNGTENANAKMAREYARASREWCGAIAALEQLLMQVVDACQQEFQDACKQASQLGLVLAGPSAVLSHPNLTANFQTRVFTAEPFNPLALMPFLLPSATAQQTKIDTQWAAKLPLLPADPLAGEQFCLVFTAGFSLAMVLGENTTGEPAFLFSFEPEVVQQAWISLRSRLLLSCPPLHLNQLDALIEQFEPTTPDYRVVTQFSRLLLKHLPSIEWDEKLRELEKEKTAETPNLKTDSLYPALENSQSQNPKSDDVELLQAFAHEVRTPLTTIRTLTRLLLKRRDLAPDIIKRLEIIDRECTEQINRMELIFCAVELETSEVKRSPVHLSAISLDQVLQQSIPRWQKQASRRNLTLDAILPQKLPDVVTNPAMLDRVLTGVIENFTRSLPAGSHIQVEVTPAGNQLKLQLQSQPDPEQVNNGQECNHTGIDKGVKLIGQMLMFQPETGNLSLNLNVTKNLFQALGGKLIVRQRPQQGEVMTIFLPLEVTNNSVLN